jgi:antitoxin ParD1/3/4
MLSPNREAEMNVSVGDRWEAFIDAIVKEGRYGSASEVVREGLRLVEEREARLRELRASVKDALDADEWYTWDEVEAHVKAALGDHDHPKAAE